MIPDLWPAFRRRPRLDPSWFEARGGAGPDEALRAGLREHVRADAAFHTCGAFHAWRRAVVPTAEAIVTRPSLASFLAHVGVELTLDRLLVSERPSLGAAYYDTLDQVDPAQLERALIEVVGEPARGFSSVFTRFQGARHLLEYSQVESVAGSLARVVSLIRRADPVAPERLIPFLRGVEAALGRGPWAPLDVSSWILVAERDDPSSSATRSPA